MSVRGSGVSETLPRNKNGLGKVLVDDAADIKSANRWDLDPFPLRAVHLTRPARCTLEV